MIADLGTKALASTRISDLKKLLGMGKAKTQSGEEEKVLEEGGKEKKVDIVPQSVAAMAIKLITLAASLSVSKAQPEDEEEETPSHEFYLLMMIYTVLVILVTVAIQSLWNGGVGQVCEAFKRKIAEVSLQRRMSHRQSSRCLLERAVWRKDLHTCTQLLVRRAAVRTVRGWRSDPWPSSRWLASPALVRTDRGWRRDPWPSSQRLCTPMRTGWRVMLIL